MPWHTLPTLCPTLPPQMRAVIQEVRSEMGDLRRLVAQQGDAIMAMQVGGPGVTVHSVLLVSTLHMILGVVPHQSTP